VAKCVAEWLGTIGGWVVRRENGGRPEAGRSRYPRTQRRREEITSYAMRQ
jgi:hypothetical protein